MHFRKIWLCAGGLGLAVEQAIIAISCVFGVDVSARIVVQHSTARAGILLRSSQSLSLQILALFS